MANDGLFFHSFTAIHRRFGTPAKAILFQTAWSIFLLLFWGTFANIITYLVFTDVLFMALVGASVIWLRKKRKDLDLNVYWSADLSSYTVFRGKPR